MKLKGNDLMKCDECGKTTRVKDLKQILPPKDEAGVLAVLVCPFCDCGDLTRVKS